MSDLEHEDVEPDSAPASTENTQSNIRAAATPSPIAALLLKVWSAIMIVSTTILSFYVFVLKDNSAIPFVVLGFIGLCMPPVVNTFRAMARNKQLRIELEERIRQAELERIREAKEREMERLRREQIIAQNEAAEQNAIKNIDVEAYQVNNSMQ